ncbi:MAG: DNA polymerase III subunit delta [SAR324 cluster bacterium]|nr:DNA polymerase III subunit delta [SAR324 cluster bacterium]
MPLLVTIWGNQQFDLDSRLSVEKHKILGDSPLEDACYIFDIAEVVKLDRAQAEDKIKDLIQVSETVSFFSPELLIILKGLEKIPKQKSLTESIEKELGNLNLVKAELDGVEAWLDQDSLKSPWPSHQHVKASQLVEVIQPLGAGKFFIGVKAPWINRRIHQQKEKEFEAISIEEFFHRRLKAKVTFDEIPGLVIENKTNHSKLVAHILELISEPPTGVSILATAFVKKLAELPKAVEKVLSSKGRCIKGEVSYDDYQPTGWVVQRAKALGCQIYPSEAALMVEVAGNDLGVLNQELQKLQIHAGGQTITTEMIFKWVSPSVHFGLFLVSEHLAKRDMEQSLKSLEQILKEKKNEASGVFNLIALQFRKLVKAAWMMESGLPIKEIASRLKMHPFLAEKLIKLAGTYRRTELEDILVYLAQQDLNLKANPKDALVILENFAFLLCRRSFLKPT